MSEPKLCYVDGSFAYFTTQELGGQTGDDWDDAPYEHNCGTPYEPQKRLVVKKWPDGDSGLNGEYEEALYQPDFNDDGTPKWEIIKLAFDCGILCPPCEGKLNSEWSVDQINKGYAPWLSDRYGSSGVVIHGGCSIPDFINLVNKAGGEVYVKTDLEAACYLLENQ